MQVFKFDSMCSVQFIQAAFVVGFTLNTLSLLAWLVLVALMLLTGGLDPTVWVWGAVAAGLAIFLWVLGVAFMRLVAESAIVVFAIHDSLRRIEQNTAGGLARG